jgi:hypothetical protein
VSTTKHWTGNPTPLPCCGSRLLGRPSANRCKPMQKDISGPRFPLAILLHRSLARGASGLISSMRRTPDQPLPSARAWPSPLSSLQDDIVSRISQRRMNDTYLLPTSQTCFTGHGCFLEWWTTTCWTLFIPSLHLDHSSYCHFHFHTPVHASLFNAERPTSEAIGPTASGRAGCWLLASLPASLQACIAATQT